MSEERYKYLLPENDLPTRWYNINADLPTELPPVLNPQIKEPITRIPECSVSDVSYRTRDGSGALY